MMFQARLAAAIEVLDDISGRHRPAAEALRDWGRAHRFAGSGDRNAIGTLVYDVLRKKSSLATQMEDASSRALVLAAAHHLWNIDVERIEAQLPLPHGPGALSPDERAALERPWAEDMPAWISGDYPQWLHPSFERAFGADAARQGRGLSARAPIDLRVNTLKIDRAKLLKAFEKFGALEGPLSPWCVRIPAPGHETRSPNVEAEPAHGKGWFEVQDAASQVAAMLSGAKPGEQVADICAGAGGKTLALAAMMRNEGQIHAHDADKHRLRPIFERLQRAGTRNVQVIGADEDERLAALAGKMDCVVIDAPCSGSGSWRRKPDAKWRLTEKQLAQRLADQREVLRRGAALVRPGGRLVYITCSVLPEENGDQVAAFVQRHPEYSLLPYTDQWRSVAGCEAPASADESGNSLLLTPANHATDGFFVAILRRAP